MLASLVRITGSGHGRQFSVVPLPLRAPSFARACAGLEAFMSSFYPKEFRVRAADMGGAGSFFEGNRLNAIVLVLDTFASRSPFGEQKQWAFLKMGKRERRPPTDRQVLFASRISGRQCVAPQLVPAQGAYGSGAPVGAHCSALPTPPCLCSLRSPSTIQTMDEASALIRVGLARSDFRKAMKALQLSRADVEQLWRAHDEDDDVAFGNEY